MPTSTITQDGHTYVVITDNNGNVITQYAADPLPSLTARSLSKFQFRSLFTLAERVNMDNGIPISGSLTAQQQAQLKTLSFDFQIADSIDLSNPLTIQGVQFLEAANLIATGRAAQVLANQTPPTS